MMKRRKAIQLTAAFLGGTIIGADTFLSGCTQPKNNTLFSEEDVLLMDEIGETILPDSDRSPGAKAAGVGKFMKTIVTDCYSAEDAAVFAGGLKKINATAKKSYGKEFTGISSQQRFDLLSAFDKEARQNEDGTTMHFYPMIKQLTIWAYFSSEVGQTKALRYNPVPGGFDGDTDYKPGDRAWVGPLCSID
jgi:hypothetical protein